MGSHIDRLANANVKRKTQFLKIARRKHDLVNAFGEQSIKLCDWQEVLY